MPIYEYKCRECSNVFEEYSTLPHDIVVAPCPKCTNPGDRVYSLSNPKMFEVFTTRNILPHGREVTVRGQRELQELESLHHVKMVDKDAPPPQTIQPIAS